MWIQLYGTYDFSVGQTRFAQGRTLELYPEGKVHRALGRGAQRGASEANGAHGLRYRHTIQAYHTDTLQAYRTDTCLLYTSPSPRDLSTSRMPSSA